MVFLCTHRTSNHVLTAYGILVFLCACAAPQCTVNSRYSGHPWDYPKWLEYRGGCISGYLEIPAAIFETMSHASSPACKVIVTG